jgi:hypothetical protein
MALVRKCGQRFAKDMLMVEEDFKKIYPHEEGLHGNTC